MGYVVRVYPTTYSPYVRPLPPPPRLHWGWVLAIDIITFGLFEIIWIFVQANWVRKVRGESRTMPWAIAYIALLPAIFAVTFAVGIALALLGKPFTGNLAALVNGISRITFAVVRLTALYTLRNELAEEPISIPTGGVMTFFFGTIYFQYHLYNFNFDEPRENIEDGTLGLSLQ